MDKKKIQRIEETSKKVEEEESRVTILDVLLDETNKDPIILIDAKGKRLRFDQIAVIPYNNKVYAVLKPLDKIENVADDEAIVFYVEERKGQDPVLMVETDEKTAIEVFDEYYNLLDEEDAKAKSKPAPKAAPKTATKTSTKAPAKKTAAAQPKKGSKK